MKEHKSESDDASVKPYTRAQRQTSVGSAPNKSALTDHVAESNHVIGWEEAKIRDIESNRKRRHIKEAIWIRKKGQKNTLNRDCGSHFLPHIYDQLLTAPPASASYRKQKTSSGKAGHSI